MNRAGIRLVGKRSSSANAKGCRPERLAAARRCRKYSQMPSPVSSRPTTPRPISSNPILPDDSGGVSGSIPKDENPVNAELDRDHVTVSPIHKSRHNFSGSVTVRGRGATTIRQSGIQARNIIGQSPEQSYITNTSRISTEGPTTIHQYTREATGDIIDHTLDNLDIDDATTVQVQDANLEYLQGQIMAKGDVKYSPTSPSHASSAYPNSTFMQNTPLPQATAASAPVRNIQDFDISTKKFNVALTFPGEIRSTITDLLPELDKTFGRENYFYDNHYKHVLAKPNLNYLLQEIYGNAKLIVVFLTKDYANKNWCNNVEWRKIQEHVFEGNGDKIMFMRADDGTNPPQGMLKQDGFIDIRNESSQAIVDFIKKRFDAI